MSEGTPIKLDTKTWISLIVIIVSASVANLAGINKMSSDLRTELFETERRFSNRLADTVEKFDQKLLSLRASMPLPEVDQRFINLERRVDRLEHK